MTLSHTRGWLALFFATMFITTAFGTNFGTDKPIDFRHPDEVSREDSTAPNGSDGIIMDSSSAPSGEENTIYDDVIRSASVTDVSEYTYGITMGSFNAGSKGAKFLMYQNPEDSKTCFSDTEASMTSRTHKHPWLLNPEEVGEEVTFTETEEHSISDEWQREYNEMCQAWLDGRRANAAYYEQLSKKSSTTETKLGEVLIKPAQPEVGDEENMSELKRLQEAEDALSNTAGSEKGGVFEIFANAQEAREYRNNILKMCPFPCLTGYSQNDNEELIRAIRSGAFIPGWIKPHTWMVNYLSKERGYDHLRSLRDYLEGKEHFRRELWLYEEVYEKSTRVQGQIMAETHQPNGTYSEPWHTRRYKVAFPSLRECDNASGDVPFKLLTRDELMDFVDKAVEEFDAADEELGQAE